MTSNQFNRLRAILVTRITLFNGRRGGEFAKLTLGDWQNAVDNTWFDKQRTEKLEPHEKALLDEFTLTYMEGKCRRIVPVLIPNNCFAGITKLVSQREAMEINPANKYVFPAARGSKTHVLGNHAIAEVCKAANTSKPITATEVRHSISTYYACLDLPEHERTVFYDHLGHSEAINKHVY